MPGVFWDEPLQQGRLEHHAELYGQWQPVACWGSICHCYSCPSVLGSISCNQPPCASIKLHQHVAALGSISCSQLLYGSFKLIQRLPACLVPIHMHTSHLNFRFLCRSCAFFLLLTFTAPVSSFWRTFETSLSTMAVRRFG